MNKYEQLSRKALGIAFIAGPLLLTIGALTFLLGIGISPDGITSWVEGIFMGFGFVILIPVYLELARLLGQRAPKLAIFCAIGAPGLVFFGVVPAIFRIAQAAFLDAGMELSAWHLSAKTLFSHPGWMPITIWSLVSFLSLILVGIGLFSYGGLSRWTAVLLILAPIILFIGQGSDETIALWRVKIIYPLATLIWLVALAPIGWRYLTGSKEELAAKVNLDPTIS